LAEGAGHLVDLESFCDAKTGRGLADLGQLFADPGGFSVKTLQVPGVGFRVLAAKQRVFPLLNHDFETDLSAAGSIDGFDQCRAAGDRCILLMVKFCCLAKCEQANAKQGEYGDGNEDQQLVLDLEVHRHTPGWYLFRKKLSISSLWYTRRVW
jgi:hypothetical protein